MSQDIYKHIICVDHSRGNCKIAIAVKCDAQVSSQVIFNKLVWKHSIINYGIKVIGAISFAK